MEILRITLTIFTILAILIVFFRIYIVLWASTIHPKPDDTPGARYGIVFGAGLEKDGSPTTVLRERLDVGIQRYQTGKINKLILSGDNRNVFYNEPFAMRDAVISAGINPGDLFVDPDGQRSFSTCLNAKPIVGQKPTILITQPFHLARVVWIARQLGMNAVGIPAKHETHHPMDVLWWYLREVGATARAGIDVLRWKTEQRNQPDRSAIK